MNTHISFQPLTGQVAVVTGASRGIGRAVAERLGQAGASVVINYAHRADQAQEVAQAVEAAGGRALTVQADMGQPAEVQRLFEQAHRHFQRLDILINNAGIADMAPLGSIGEGRWSKLG